MRRQRGVALLIALVVAALAALLAIGAIDRLGLDSGRSQAIMHGEQSLQYAQGMEYLARRMIREALEAGQSSRDLDGAWTAPFAVPGGEVLGRVLDQSGRFNLNTLTHPDDARRSQAMQQFRQLLAVLELDPALAVELAEWLAEDVTATDPRYANRQPPYQPAGLPLAHASELNWLYSMDAAAWTRLAPHITALPSPDTRLNVNSASATVLASLSPGLDLEQARRLYQDGPFANLDAFLAHPSVAAVELPAVHGVLATESVWYVAQARVVLDGAARDYYRLIHASEAGVPFRRFSLGIP